jgi:hypothetical protein
MPVPGRKRVAVRKIRAAPRVQLDVLVEEWSAEIVVQKFFRPWLLHESGRPLNIETRRFNGKPDLVDNLPIVLSGYARARRGGQDVRVAVLVDQDTDDCSMLKKNLERAAAGAGLDSLSRSGGPAAVVNRIAVRELENWYFGDWQAVRSAFPKVTGRAPAPYRTNADATTYKTSDRFARTLAAAGVGETSKRVWAERIAVQLDVSRNQSDSFRAFASGLLKLVSQ